MEQKQILAHIKPKTIKLDPEALREKFEERYKGGYKAGLRKGIANLQRVAIELSRGLHYRDSSEFSRGIEMIFHSIVETVKTEMKQVAEIKSMPSDADEESPKIIERMVKEQHGREEISIY